jgi:hypothetical protein
MSDIRLLAENGWRKPERLACAAGDRRGQRAIPSPDDIVVDAARASETDGMQK